MNRYIIPICDMYSEQIWIETISARSINECQEKIMQSIINQYNFDDYDSWNEFVQDMDDKEILIGEIKDIETL